MAAVWYISEFCQKQKIVLSVSARRAVECSWVTTLKPAVHYSWQRCAHYAFSLSALESGEGSGPGVGGQDIQETVIRKQHSSSSSKSNLLILLLLVFVFLLFIRLLLLSLLLMLMHSCKWQHQIPLSSNNQVTGRDAGWDWGKGNPTWSFTGWIIWYFKIYLYICDYFPAYLTCSLITYTRVFQPFLSMSTFSALKKWHHQPRILWNYTFQPNKISIVFLFILTVL